MTIFERVKAGVSLRAAAERYGFKIAGNSMICCPFHNDRHPSMKLNDDYFYCFSCGATGDVIGFVGKVFDDNPYEAAQRLATDFDIEADKLLSKRIKQKRSKDKAFHEDEIYCLRVLCDYLHTLEDWKVSYAPESPDEEYDERFVEACQKFEYITFLADILTAGSLEERIAEVEELMRDGKIQELEKRFIQIRREERDEQYARNDE